MITPDQSSIELAESLDRIRNDIIIDRHCKIIDGNACVEISGHDTDSGNPYIFEFDADIFNLV